MLPISSHALPPARPLGAFDRGEAATDAFLPGDASAEQFEGFPLARNALVCPARFKAAVPAGLRLFALAARPGAFAADARTLDATERFLAGRPVPANAVLGLALGALCCGNAAAFAKQFGVPATPAFPVEALGRLPPRARGAGRVADIAHGARVVDAAIVGNDIADAPLARFLDHIISALECLATCSFCQKIARSCVTLFAKHVVRVEDHARNTAVPDDAGRRPAALCRIKCTL